MIKKEFLIAVIDGQGGGIGRQYIESLTKALPKDLPSLFGLSEPIRQQQPI